MWNFPFKSSFKLRKNPTAVGVVRLCIKGYDSVCCGTIYNYDDMAVSESKAFDLSLRGTILQVRKGSEVVKLWNVFCKWVFNIPISHCLLYNLLWGYMESESHSWCLMLDRLLTNVELLS